MKPFTIRRVPWTCEWGWFGVATEDLGAAGTKVDDVFWACHHPTRAPHLRLTARDECQDCPFWEEAARLRMAS
jgi:hypothetical protein